MKRPDLVKAFDSVVDALRGRRLLVILDNCEHLLDAAAELVERVTESCPTVTVLATSREPLGVAGERVWAVPSLPAATDGVRVAFAALNSAMGETTLTEYRLTPPAATTLQASRTCF